MPFREETASWIERLIAIAGIGIGDHGMHDHLVAILIDASGIAAEDHGESISAEPNPLQAPEIVVVERRSTDVDSNPATRTLGLRDLTDLERRKRIFRGETNSANCEHGFSVPSGLVADAAQRAGSSCHDGGFGGEGGELGEDSVSAGQAGQYETVGVDTQHRRCSTDPVGGCESGVISHIENMD